MGGRSLRCDLSPYGAVSPTASASRATTQTYLPCGSAWWPGVVSYCSAFPGAAGPLPSTLPTVAKSTLR